MEPCLVLCDAGDRPEQGGFPRAVVSDDGKHFAFLDVKADVLDGIGIILIVTVAYAVQL